MTARHALFVAPADSSLSTPSQRLEALGWLRNQAVGRGFKVAIASGSDPAAELERFAAGISAGDIVFVHVSGRLATSDSLALGAGPFPLSRVTDALAARGPGQASFVLDLVRGDDLEGEADALLAEAARALGAEERGYPVLSAVRDPAGGGDRVAFTRVAVPPLDEDGPLSGEPLLSAMHDRAAAGQSPSAFALFRGGPDATIDGRVAEATRAGDWPRVVELRMDRAGTLATAQRAQELASAARILQTELQDPHGAVDLLEHARSLAPKRAAIAEALRSAYEASGRAAPIDPAEYAAAFAAHRRAGQMDAALLDAMVLEQIGAAAPEHQALVEQLRSVGPMQVLRPLDADAWHALRAPGFDEALASLFAAVHEAAIASRVEQLSASRRRSPDTPRLDPESTISAVRTLHWAARVLGVECPALHAGTDDDGEPVAHRAPQQNGERPSITLAPRVLSGASAKQLAFLAGRALTWCRPEYGGMLHYRTTESLRELLDAALDLGGAGPPVESETRRLLARHLGDDDRAALREAAQRAPRGEIALEPWIRSAELTAARAGLLLCGDLKTAVACVQAEAGKPGSPGRPTAERVIGDLLAFCGSRAHAGLRAGFLKVPAAS